MGLDIKRVMLPSAAAVAVSLSGCAIHHEKFSRKVDGVLTVGESTTFVIGAGSLRTGGNNVIVIKGFESPGDDLSIVGPTLNSNLQGTDSQRGEKKTTGKNSIPPSLDINKENLDKLLKEGNLLSR